MRLILSLLILLMTTVGYGESYSELKLDIPHDDQAEVNDVRLLETKIVLDTNENFENRSLVMTLGLRAQASLCETYSDIKIPRTQSSLESGMDVGELYFTVPTQWKDGCSTGSSGKPQYFKFQLTFSVDQRKISEVGKPWPPPRWMSDPGGAFRYLSFYRTRIRSIEVFQLYRLDFTDIKNVKLEFKKHYSYIQGEAQDIEAGWLK